MPHADDEVFGEAIALADIESQTELVRSMCGDNSQQCERVLTLLHSYRAFQNRPAGTSILDRSAEIFEAFGDTEQVESGQLVGPYELIEKIGEGGCAVVYQARQHQPLVRDVALKLLKPGMDSQRILARFALERRALSLLNNAGITRILDAGVQANGRPFFAMELVKDAVTITRYCQDQRLDVRQRLNLLIKVCEIVQYAHQHGFIHRDLKPSNILLENDSLSTPLPKVIDFGIAKMVGGDSEVLGELTNVGERFGTPAYMSPEQALHSFEGVDIRSDVYSLGALMYELLVGKTPFECRVTRQPQAVWTDPAFWETPIPWPSKCDEHAMETPSDAGNAALTRSQKVSVELDWICQKALAHQRSQRYQTVADLAKDLQCYMSGLPVEAAGPGLMYRVKKLVDRNRVATGALVTLLGVLISTSTIATILAERATLARAEADRRLNETLAIQARLAKETETALQAQHRAEALLRSIQVQDVVGRSFAGHIIPLIDSVNAVDTPVDIADSNGQINAEVLVQPHPRLFIKGDWSWTTGPAKLELESYNALVRLKSREVASVVVAPARMPITDRPSQQNATGPILQAEIPQSRASGPPLNGRLIFQQRILDELSRVFDPHDPFVAEVLDNCGLYALDIQEFATAEEYLTRSAEIWQSTGKYHANAAQSKIFLAESLLARSAIADSQQALEQASRLLEHVEPAEPGLPALRSYLQTLKARIARQALTP